MVVKLLGPISHERADPGKGIYELEEQMMTGTKVSHCLLPTMNLFLKFQIKLQAKHQRK